MPMLCAQDRWRREDPGMDARVLDVHLVEMKKDPIGVAKRVFGHLGLDFADSTRSAMEAWLAEKQVRHGGHVF